MAHCTAQDHSYDQLQSWIEEKHDIEIYEYDNTLLMASAQMGHLKCMTLLLDSGVRIDAPNWSGETALFRASRYGQYDCLQLLLQRGANTQIACQVTGASPLDIAIITGHQQCARALIDQGMWYSKQWILMITSFDSFIDENGDSYLPEERIEEIERYNKSIDSEYIF